jgi:hypothetical protein
MAAPVPAPSIPVLTSRHPGVTPQPASASDATAGISELDARQGTRKSLIVAMARKLLIELWRFVTTGETLLGVKMRPA